MVNHKSPIEQNPPQAKDTQQDQNGWLKPTLNHPNFHYSE
jgi:hypothetical protein